MQFYVKQMFLHSRLIDWRCTFIIIYVERLYAEISFQLPGCPVWALAARTWSFVSPGLHAFSSESPQVQTTAMSVPHFTQMIIGALLEMCAHMCACSKIKYLRCIWCWSIVAVQCSDTTWTQNGILYRAGATLILTNYMNAEPLACCTFSTRSTRRSAPPN